MMGALANYLSCDWSVSHFASDCGRLRSVEETMGRARICYSRWLFYTGPLIGLLVVKGEITGFGEWGCIGVEN